MADMARKNPSFPDLVAPFDDEGSVIRSRNSREGAGNSSHSSSRAAAPGSLHDRLERKVRLATVLMRDLPSSDARVRLLHIAIMRRDGARRGKYDDSCHGVLNGCSSCLVLILSFCFLSLCFLFLALSEGFTASGAIRSPSIRLPV